MVGTTPFNFDDYPLELPVGTLRLEVQSIIKHYAEVYQCPRDFVTSAVFGIASSLCGKHVTIFDGKYRNYPNHWICHVAPSGSNKSAPIKALLAPIHAVESERYRAYREAYKAYRKQPDGDEPLLVPMTVSDVTPEALYKVLNDRSDANDGLLLYRDEIKGFIDDIGRYHNSGEVSNYLSIWDGTTFPVTRKTQAPLYVENPYLCIMGGIQPEVFGNAFNEGLADVGFIQRWLFVFPDPTISDFYSERTIDPVYSTAWNEIVSKLLKIEDIELTLSPEAKKLYIDFYNETIIKTISAHPYACSMLSKLRIQVLKWCALTHVLSCNDAGKGGQYFVLPSSTEITGEEMKYSIECIRYFEYCGHKALSLIRGAKPVKRRSQAEMVCDLVYSIGIDNVNITKLAEGLGVSRQYVSKVINQDSRLHGCGCGNARSPPNTSVERVNMPQPRQDSSKENLAKEVAV